MTLAPPEALRLVTLAGRRKVPKAPFGLRSWSPEAEAIAVLLDGRGPDPGSVAGVAVQLPHASTLPTGTPVYVLGTAARDAGLWRLFTRGRAVPRAARCTALVTRGYVAVGAGLDEASGHDLAWGLAP